jgi:hypothetical protein
VDGGVVAFLGASGWGKSTLAASLHARGFPLVVDDIVAIRFDGGHPSVYPGFPQFKLWPDSLQALGEDPDSFPRLYEQREKRARRIGDRFYEGAPLPLRQIYLLSRGDAVERTRLSARDAMLQITGHSFGIQWLHGVSGAAFFHQRAQLARQVPVHVLKRPWDLAFLPRVLELVLEDLGVDAPATAR